MALKMKYDILSVQERANARKRAGHDVINGCAGMLFEEDKKLTVFKEVNDHIRSGFDSYLAYPSVLGSDRYKEGVLSWLFQEDKAMVESRFDIPFSVTLGGTGALYMAFHHFAKEKAVLLLPSLRWPNYDTLAGESHLAFDVHNFLTSEGHLDIESIKKHIEGNLRNYDKVLLSVNDPCENPIGYCMTKREYEDLFDLLRSYDRKVTLLLDIAYFDYAADGFPFLSVLKERPSLGFDLFLAFSASKSFGLYGLRLGALIGLLEKGADHVALLDDFKSIARGTYSCANNGAMGPMADFFNDGEAVRNVKARIKEERERLAEIGAAVSDVLDSLSIAHFPYKGGFYLTFSTDDAVAYCAELEKKDIYFAPIDETHIRIAVSGLNREECEKLRRRLIHG